MNYLINMSDKKEIELLKNKFKEYKLKWLNPETEQDLTDRYDELGLHCLALEEAKNVLIAPKVPILPLDWTSKAKHITREKAQEILNDHYLGMNIAELRYWHSVGLIEKGKVRATGAGYVDYTTIQRIVLDYGPNGRKINVA